MKERSVPYLAGLFFDGISSSLFMLALPWLMLQSENMGTFVVMIALMCTVTNFLITPYACAMIDKYSRKNILLLVQIIQFVTASIVFVVYLVGSGSLIALAIPQLIFWISTGVSWNTNNAFIQENFKKHEYAKISGYQEIINQASVMGAGVLGVMVLEYWTITEFSLFAVGASTISTICYLKTPYHSRELKMNSKTPIIEQLEEIRMTYLKNPQFYNYILLSCLSYPVLMVLGRLVPIWFSELNISGDWLAMYSMAFGVGALCTGLLVTQIMSRVSYINIMQYSMLCLAFILLIMGVFKSSLFIIMLMVGYGFFNALNRIARINWMHHKVLMAQRGRVDGGLSMFTSFAQSLGYILIAYLSYIDAVEYGFLMIGGIMIFCGCWMTRLGKGMTQIKN